MTTDPGSTPPDAPALAPAGPDVPWQRLHPLTFVHRVSENALTLAVLAGSVVFGTARNGEAVGSLAVAAIGLLLYGPAVVLGYLRYRYRVTDVAVEVQSGVFARQHRVIPLTRVQAVEVERPLLARWLGTARVLLLTGSGAGAEATLAYVGLAEAEHLRDTLRARPATRPAGEDASAAVPEAEASRTHPAEAPPARVLVQLSRARLVRAGFYDLSLRFLAVAYTLLELTGRGPSDVADWIDGRTASPDFSAVQAGALLVLAVGLGVVAVGLVAWAAGFVGTVLRFAGFRLTDDGARLHVAAGLLSRWERNVPRTRIQALHLRASPLMDAAGFVRVEAQTLGVDASGGFEVLTPIATRAEADALAQTVEPLAPVTAWNPVAPGHAHRLALRYAAVLVLLVAGVTVATGQVAALAGLLALLPAFGLARRQARRHRWALTADALHVAWGGFWHRRVALPRRRVQTATVRAGAWQRRWGLASVVVDTAGGLARGLVVADLAADEAHDLVAALRRAAPLAPAAEGDEPAPLL